MIVEQVVPHSVPLEIDDLTASLTVGHPGEPFSESTLDFVASFSQAIFRSRAAALYPELQALAFWMRKAELQRLKAEFCLLQTADTIFVPRGVVFHIPPSNVDTIFVYSWLLSLLAGNRNVVRLSQRTTPQTDLLCQLLRDTLAAAGEAMRGASYMVRYSHDRETTAALSALCDVRVIWGGDATVNRVREIAIPPHAKELTFADRSSLAAIDITAYLLLDDAERAKLAEQFFNDVFWFDQMACSSPRIIVWVGELKAYPKAQQLFFEALLAHIYKKKHSLPASAWMDKFSFACKTILDHHVTAYKDAKSLTTIDVASAAEMPRDHSAHGLLFQVRLDNLSHLVPHLQRRDQTITYLGFDPAQLREFIRQLAGRAIDRIVPIGQALQFNRYWDGYDLLQDFTKRVFVGR